MESIGRSDRVGRVLEDRRWNAVLAWLLVGFVAVAAAGSLLSDRLLWAGFAAGVAVLLAVPPVAYRDPTVMLPWEVALLAALPVVVRAAPLAPIPAQVATHFSVAALALVVAVELHVFTTVRMSAWFAVLFVVVTTMATAGVWAVVQWLSDVYLGTAFVFDPDLTEAQQEAAVMWNFVAATAVGVLAGVVFDSYFRRRARPDERLPGDVGEAEP